MICLPHRKKCGARSIGPDPNERVGWVERPCPPKRDSAKAEAKPIATKSMGLALLEPSYIAEGAHDGPLSI